MPLANYPLTPHLSLKEFTDLPHRLGRLFEHGDGIESSVAFTPPVGVVETNDNVVVNVELAGLRPEDVSVELENGVLTIKGEKRPGTILGSAGDAETGSENNERVRLDERRFGKFSRAFALPRSIAVSDAKASLDQGVLTVLLPKSSEARSRRIEIAS